MNRGSSPRSPKLIPFRDRRRRKVDLEAIVTPRQLARMGVVTIHHVLRLELGQRVATLANVGEMVGAVAVGDGAQIDRIAQQVNAGQRDLNAADAVFVRVHDAIVVGIHIDDAVDAAGTQIADVDPDSGHIGFPVSRRPPDR